MMLCLNNSKSYNELWIKKIAGRLQVGNIENYIQKEQEIVHGNIMQKIRRNLKNYGNLGVKKIRRNERFILISIIKKMHLKYHVEKEVLNFIILFIKEIKTFVKNVERWLHHQHLKDFKYITKSIEQIHNPKIWNYVVEVVIIHIQNRGDFF